MDKSNSDIAIFLRRAADMLEIRGESDFKARAYRTAAATVEDVSASLAGIAREEGAKALQQLPGVGKSLAAQVAEFVETGTSSAFERLREEVPESVVEVLGVRGIGIKMATTLYQGFDVVDLEDLERFAEGGGFEAVPGLGDKTIERLVAAVRAAAKARPRVALDEAERRADALAARLVAARPDAEIVVAGEVRRRVARVAALDLLAVVDGGGPSLAYVLEPTLVAADRVETVVDGLRATVHVAPLEHRAVALVRATGSRRHVRQLEERASALGVALGGESEEEVYRRLGLAFIAPERREGTGEVE
jgi:DNA polymerase (family 10)